MKNLFLLFITIVSTAIQGQINWQNPAGAPTNGFWDMDTLNNKLYVSFGGVYEFDGNNWTWLNNYNNSLNTPNKTKSCIKNLDGKLYCGAKDFNTGGEGDIHYYDGSNWSLFQNTNFPYNGNNKIRSFVNYDGYTYMSGIFRVPSAPTYSNIAKWNGTEWINVGRNFTYYNTPNEIRDMEVFQNDLYITDKNNVWKYNGSSWDSLFNYTSYPSGSNISGLVTYNNELYISGYFNLDASNTNILLIKYNGSNFTPLAKASQLSNILTTGIYSNIGRMNVVAGKLMFIAKKASDNSTYLVSYDGTNFTELVQLAVSGDWSYAPGSEYTTYTKIAYYNGNLWIGGNFQKIGGQTLTGLVYAPFSITNGVNESENSEDHISMYPNPSSSEICFRFNENIHPDLIITDIIGKEVFKQKEISGNTSISTRLQKGLYLYRLEYHHQRIKTGKLIIE